MYDFPPEFYPVSHPALARPVDVGVIFPEPLRKDLLLPEKCPNANIGSLLQILAGAGLEVIGQNDAFSHIVVVKSVDGKGTIRGNVGLDEGLDQGICLNPKTGEILRMTWKKSDLAGDTSVVNGVRRMYGLPRIEQVANILAEV